MNIAYWPKDHGACGYYRCRLPAERLKAHGYADTFVADMCHTVDDISYATANSDVLVMQYPCTRKQLDLIIYFREKTPDQRIVIEMDDNPYAVSPFNELGYPDFGTEEVEIQFPGEDKPRALWQHGRNGFDIERNRERVGLFTEAVKRASLVTTTVEPLADVFREHSKNVVAWPNCLDFNVWKPFRPKPKDDIIRIGWHGGASHYEDWHMIAPAMLRIMERHKNVRPLIMGSVWPGMFPNLPEGSIDHADWCDIHMFPYVLAWLPIDIGICPLVETEFSKCKSPLKWEEYAALGLPVVASNVEPYCRTVRHGETGLLADTAEAFEEHLEALIADSKKRRDLGANALCQVRAGFDIDVRIRDLWGAYKNIMESANGGDTGS